MTGGMGLKVGANSYVGRVQLKKKLRFCRDRKSGRLENKSFIRQSLIRYQPFSNHSSENTSTRIRRPNKTAQGFNEKFLLVRQFISERRVQKIYINPFSRRDLIKNFAIQLVLTRFSFPPKLHFVYFERWRSTFHRGPK